MNLDGTAKLFVGLKLDSELRREMEEPEAKGRAIFREGDPAHLDVVENDGVRYVGRVIEPGTDVGQLDDLKRNILSILRVTFPNHRPSGNVKLFAVQSSGAGSSGPTESPVLAPGDRMGRTEIGGGIR